MKTLLYGISGRFEISEEIGKLKILPKLKNKEKKIEKKQITKQ